ncbi:hypothetical protein [Clostridium sp.]|uniref:hypothetical protein n=1 Tax=Clostridium sp. TaxID=1506 RepID=UPI001A50B27D|nr:hypothetical protein [Clostridium sp.]MBK5242627.1 hypothetical protein [Clostridium sp.]
MFKKYREVYLINKSTNTKFSLCKVLNEYDSKESAMEDIMKILTKKINEIDLLKEFDGKEI